MLRRFAERAKANRRDTQTSQTDDAATPPNTYKTTMRKHVSLKNDGDGESREARKVRDSDCRQPKNAVAEL